MKNYSFDGETFDAAKDSTRLTYQHDRLYALMKDGRARTLSDIARALGAPPQSVSARLRDLRKPRFGGHDVIRSRQRDGVWLYRLVLAETGTQRDLF